ncbi:MAG: BtrH N-terminal domain-containing protein [Flavobacteriales bacterium]|nr:BtrH N-terminal domain-containing protein [Flavobacteriales bacterium]
MKIDFEHRQSAHCETGVISNLMRFHGLNISEPLALGIGSGLFFSHFPFLKVNGLPVTSYRNMPGDIFKKFSKRMGVQMKRQKFSSKEKAMKALDDVLEQGYPVGMLTSVFYLPYLPRAFRFHFNAHNIVVFGKEGDEYLVSDPIMEEPVKIDRRMLIRARFAKGMPNTNGRMYYPTHVPKDVDINAAIIKGLKFTAKDMGTIPIPIFGGKAIGFLAKRVRNYEKKFGKRGAAKYLGNIVRMQEEIGTGGAGFRFMYGAFLQEAAAKLGNPLLHQKSLELTKIGDLWRSFAYDCGRMCKDRAGDLTYDDLADQLEKLGKKEILFFRSIHKMKL